MAKQEQKINITSIKWFLLVSNNRRWYYTRTFFLATNRTLVTIVFIRDKQTCYCLFLERQIKTRMFMINLNGLSIAIWGFWVHDHEAKKGTEHIYISSIVGENNQLLSYPDVFVIIP